MPYKNRKDFNAWASAWKKANREKVHAQKRRARDRKRGGPPKPRETHGQAGKKRTTEYNSWRSAKNRCTNPNIHNWHRYGGRGVEFRFLSFSQFFAELGPKPTGCSLDRYPNPDGHYEPGNVRWATMKEQQNNKGTVSPKGVLSPYSETP